MTYFLMAALALLTAAGLTRPLWQRRSHSAQARRAANVAAYQSRCRELDAERQAGLLSAADADALKAELDARLLADAAPPDAVARDAAPRTGLAVALALLLGSTAALWYWQAGSWRTAAQIATARTAPVGIPQPPDVLAMVATLEARMQQSPDDPEGWAMLGRSYFVMERYADAAKAYAQANERSGSNNPGWLTGEGEALTLARDRDLQGRPQQLFEAALKLDPDDGKSRWYAGLAAQQMQDYLLARSHYERLLTQELPEEIRSAVQRRMAEIAAATGTAPLPASTAASPPAETAPAPADDVLRDSATTGVQLTVQVALAPGVTAPANAVLFVFAKAANGPPMPLAVQRITQPRFPLTVLLDESMAMTPALSLAQFDRYVVTARLSTSGSVQAAPGDLQGQQAAARADAAQAIAITIGGP